MTEKLHKIKAVQEHYNNKAKEVKTIMSSRRMSDSEQTTFQNKLLEYLLAYNVVTKCVRILEGLD